jgi:hypothetical protein
MTLKNIKFTFAQPFCSCKKQHVTWYLLTSAEWTGLTTVASTVDALVFKCNLCGAKISFPYKDLKATLMFEQGFPGGPGLDEEDEDDEDEDDDEEEDDDEYEDYSSNVINLNDYRNKSK